MKKCPFCAEEIQDEAIKCRFCNSFLSAAPNAATPVPASQPTSAPNQAKSEDKSEAPRPPFGPATRTDTAVSSDRRTIYDGSPSWKAYLGVYIITAIVALILIAILNALAKSDAGVQTRVLNVVIPLAVAFVVCYATHLKRRSIRFRVTNTAIEYERGLISKRIDVLQLWRIRDVVYKQNLVDRILGIAHVEVVAQDAKNPDLEIVGMPASRQLFEQLRDSIEIQRQAKNVVGVIS